MQYQSQTLQTSQNFYADYDCGGFYDEMFAHPGHPRPWAMALTERLTSLTADELIRRQRAADHELLNMGITFNVYGHEAGTEKIWPFDLIPRIIPMSEWRLIEAGLRQRIKALNMFIADMYGEQAIIRDGIVPSYMTESSKGFLPKLRGMKPPEGFGATSPARIWCEAVMERSMS